MSASSKPQIWLVPGLLGPLPRYAEVPAERLPNLQRLLARADRSASVDGFHAALAQLFGFETADADFPSAALAWLGETGQPADGPLLQADGVFLRPDQDRLLLSDQPKFDLTEQESAQFQQAFNRHFAEDGVTLIASSAGSWYLQAANLSALRTSPLDDVVGRNVDFFLPTGPDQRFWRGLLNETQMLFHALDVNQQRLAAGKVPISGIWLSGGGDLPKKTLTSVTSIAGDLDATARGLAALASIDVLEQRVSADLLLDRRCWRPLLESDIAAWLNQLRQIDDELGQKFASRVAFELWTCDGRRFHWQPSMKRRFWRKSPAFFDWVEQGS